MSSGGDPVSCFGGGDAAVAVVAVSVADAGAAVVVGPLPLGPSLRRPARTWCRAQADRPHLVETDDASVAGRGLAQLEDPRRLLLVVGVGAGLPGASALEGEAGLGEQR